MVKPSIKPILIVQCERLSCSDPALFAQIGDVADMVAKPIAITAVRIETCNIAEGEALPAPGDLAGAILTGAGAMVDDDHAWIAVLRTWIVEAMAARLPLLGICFGHQIMAAALDGRVGSNACGPEYGTVQVNVSAAARWDPLASGLPARFDAQVAHFQTVAELPADAVALAFGASGLHMVRFGPQSWGVQFHPEFETKAVDAIIGKVAAGLQSEERSRLITDRARLRPSPVAAQIIARFGRHVATINSAPFGIGVGQNSGELKVG